MKTLTIQVQNTSISAKADQILSQLGLEGNALIYLRTFLLLVLAILISYVLWRATRKILITLIHTLAKKSKTKWDDYLMKHRFFNALAHLVPFFIMEAMVETVFVNFPAIKDLLLRVMDILIVLIILYSILRFLNAARSILKEMQSLKDKPIDSYFQLTKIVVSGFLVILMISIALDVNPLVTLTSMGALTAILILVFKDTILGFVGSVQLASNDMIRVGDWVTMEKYGADGDVTKINLATVKIQNFDKTITTIPTYAFISDSFKNWRGMKDSDGRRLMRSIHIKIQSVKFCSEEMLNRMGEIELIRSYIDQKEQEILEYNRTNDINKTVLLNGRNQTNLGVFSHYVNCYLKQSEDINSNMTLMVRQLPSTSNGVPVQVYAFTKTKDWPEYERVMANIFDHLLAAVPYFDLEVFESPTGTDFQRLGNDSF
jgi:miniconductance mechanosensitive channel